MTGPYIVSDDLMTNHRVCENGFRRDIHETASRRTTHHAPSRYQSLPCSCHPRGEEKTGHGDGAYHVMIECSSYSACGLVWVASFFCGRTEQQNSKYNSINCCTRRTFCFAFRVSCAVRSVVARSTAQDDFRFFAMIAVIM